MVNKVKSCVIISGNGSNLKQIIKDECIDKSKVIDFIF